MDEWPTKRKLNPESVSPEANQAKKHQVGLLPDTFIQSLPGEVCPHCKKECTLESKALHCDLCGTGHTMNANKYLVSCMIISTM